MKYPVTFASCFQSFEFKLLLQNVHLLQDLSLHMIVVIILTFIISSKSCTGQVSMQYKK